MPSKIEHPFMPFSHWKIVAHPSFLHLVLENSRVGAAAEQIECPLHPPTCIHVCWPSDPWLKPQCLVYFPQLQIGCSHVRVAHGGRLISFYATRPPLNCAVCDSLVCSVSWPGTVDSNTEWWPEVVAPGFSGRTPISILTVFPLLASLVFHPLSNRILTTFLVTANNFLLPSGSIITTIQQANFSESLNWYQVHWVC